MTYDETLEYLYKAAPAFEKTGASAYKEGLENTLALDSHFGRPHESYSTVHVAGTNGKGSCSHTLAAILQSQGYRTGLYTSPHLRDFTERVKVDGKPMPRERVVRFVEEERGFFEKLSPSFFELTTALAFKYFEEEKVDIAVIEVGLGGRLDCTNVIRPLMSVITNISLDHTQFLGGTLGEIAREKAGIIKENTPCLVGEWVPETREVFERVARERNAPLFFAGDFENESVPFELEGAYQEKNRNTVLSAVRILREKIEISGGAVRRGMARVCELTGLEGRWQTIRRRPLVICDTGHNPAGWEYLAPQIAATAGRRRAEAAARGETSKTRMVFGMVDDKDVGAVMDLLPREAEYYFCRAETHRAVREDVLLSMARDRGLGGSAHPSVGAAYAAAMASAGEGDFIFVGGSSYVVADFLTGFDAPEDKS